MEKTCENCVYEYTCDWTPAAEENFCENWTYEGRKEDGNTCYMEPERRYR